MARPSRMLGVAAVLLSLALGCAAQALPSYSHTGLAVTTGGSTSAVLFFPSREDPADPDSDAIDIDALVVQRSASQAFTSPVAVAAGVAASALPGYFQVSDPASNWPADPANPGSKLRPWYRVTWCLNATDCTAGNATSAAAQPVDWFHQAAFEAPAVGSAVLVTFPNLAALPLTYVIERAAGAAFDPALPTTHQLGAPVLAPISGNYSRLGRGYFSSLNVLADSTAAWPADPADSTKKLTQWYRVAACLDANCTQRLTTAAAQPSAFFHQAVFDGTGTTVAFTSLPLPVTVKRADTSAFDSALPGTRSLDTSALPGTSNMTFLYDTLAGVGIGSWYRVSYCLDLACGTAYTTAAAQPADFLPLAVAQAHAGHGSPVMVSAPALPTLKYVLQRSPSSTFPPASTATLPGPALTFSPGATPLDVYTDNTTAWPANPADPSPGSKAAAPWYRFALCLDAACGHVAALGAVQPSVFYHYGVYQAHAGAGSPVKLSFPDFHPVLDAFIDSSPDGISSWTQVGPQTAPATSGLDTFTTSTATWAADPGAGAGAKLAPYYRVRLCLAGAGACGDVAIASVAALPLNQFDGSTLNLVVVPSGSPSPLGCGNLLTGQPCSSVQDAVAAAPDGATVLVTPGFQLGAGLDLSGKAVRLQSILGKEHTFLAAPAHTPILTIEGGAGAGISTVTTAVISGFTIMGGTNALGGCVYLNASSPTFEDVIFTGCQGAKGGAVHVTGGATPVFRGVTFSLNSASDSGGDMYVEDSSPFLEDCVFGQSAAPYGGNLHITGTASPTIQTSQFTGGVAAGAADSHGGCLAVDGGATPTVLDSSFDACQAGLSGGAVAVLEGAGPVFVDTNFTNGRSGGNGGCMYVYGGGQPAIQGGMFSGCATLGAAFGGALHLGIQDPTVLPSSAFLNGTHFLGNLALQRGGAVNIWMSFVTALNCYFDGNSVAANGMGGTFNGAFASLTLMSSTITNSAASYGGGAMWFEQCATYLPLPHVLTLVDVTITNSWGGVSGGIVVFLSSLRMQGVRFVNVFAVADGGGLTAQYGDVIGSDVEFRGTYSMGATSGAVYSADSVIVLQRAYAQGCSAIGGGGFAKIMKSTMSTTVFQDSVFEDNYTPEKGGVFLIEGADTVTLVNVTATNNRAKQGGFLWTKAPVPATILQSTLVDNYGQAGGAVFVAPRGKVDIIATLVQGNTAEESGGALAIAEDATVNIISSAVLGNGVTTAPGTHPPVGGGAICLGYPMFNPVGTAYPPATLTVTGLTSFSGNTARNAGGAILVEAGNLVVNGATFHSNSAIGGDGLDGMGGAIALSERCATPATCTTVLADIEATTFSSNTAKLAGGAVSFTGNSLLGMLRLAGSSLAGNTAVYSPDPADASDGAGGALFLGRKNFTIEDSDFNQNSAFYGGAAYISTDLAGSTLSGLNFTDNEASAGSAAYWLTFLSPDAALDCAGCRLPPAGAVATEIVGLQYGSTPSNSAVANEDLPGFTVDLVDFYGNTAAAEMGGMCTVDDPHPNANYPAVIRALGSTESISMGSATFSRIQLQGHIGTLYGLSITCQRSTIGRTKLLQLASTPALPELPLPLTVAPCRAGFQPNRAQDSCIECPYGTFNFDGTLCLSCPTGAVCPGKADLLAEPNYWRSGNVSADFYACKTPGVCQEGPVAGDEACKPGQHGPICAVCDTQYYKFSGGCRSCQGSSQAKGMLSAAVILIVLLVSLMFARDWDFGSGPGILTKLKILLTHFQMMSLFRDYDLVWPTDTHDAFNYFEFLNVGLSITAPECFVGASYNFYWFYVFTMTLPFIMVGLCVAFFAISHVLLKHLDPSGKRRLLRKGFVGWLGGLQIRCWKNAFWFVTLLYPRCAMTALQLFGLQKVDDGWYLSVDFSIMTKPAHGPVSATYIKYMVPGIALLIVFALVIPTFWFLILWYHRRQLDEPLVEKKYGFLYSSYRRDLPYWETTEMLRKFLVALLPVFIKPQSTGSLQATVGQIIMVFYLLLTTLLKPFANTIDNYLQIISLCVLFLVLMSGAAAKWAHLTASGDKILSAGQLLLTVSVGVILGGAVFVNGVAILLRWRRNRKQRTSKVASLMEGAEGDSSDPSEGAGTIGKGAGAAQLAAIKVRAGATNDSEGAGAVGALKAAYSAAPASSAGLPSPDRHLGGKDTPRSEEGTPRHGEESPLLLKKQPQRKTGDGRRTGEGAGAVSPRSLPPASGFRADSRVEKWIAGSEPSYDKESLIKHVSEKERLTGAGSPSRTPRDTAAPGTDPLNLPPRP